MKQQTKNELFGMAVAIAVCILAVLVGIFVAGNASAQSYLMVDPEEVPIWDDITAGEAGWSYNRKPVLLATDSGGDLSGSFFLRASDDSVQTINVTIHWDTTYLSWNLTFTHGSSSWNQSWIQYEEPPTGISYPTPTQYLSNIPIATANAGATLCDYRDDHQSGGSPMQDPNFMYGVACMKMRVIHYGGVNGPTVNVTMDLGDVEDAFDPDQETQANFVRDPLDSTALTELTPPEFSKFAPGDVVLPVVVPLPVPGEESNTDIAVNLSTLGVTIGSTQYVAVDPADLVTMKTMVRTLLTGVLTIVSVVAYIRMIREVLGG